MKTLLVVDDDLDMLDFYKELLSPSYHVITALSGIEALNILKAAKSRCGVNRSCNVWYERSSTYQRGRDTGSKLTSYYHLRVIRT